MRPLLSTFWPFLVCFGTTNEFFVEKATLFLWPSKRVQSQRTWWTQTDPFLKIIRQCENYYLIPPSSRLKWLCFWFKLKEKHFQVWKWKPKARLLGFFLNLSHFLIIFVQNREWDDFPGNDGLQVCRIGFELGPWGPEGCEIWEAAPVFDLELIWQDGFPELLFEPALLNEVYFLSHHWVQKRFNAAPKEIQGAWWVQKVEFLECSRKVESSHTCNGLQNLLSSNPTPSHLAHL